MTKQTIPIEKRALLERIEATKQRDFATWPYWLTWRERIVFDIMQNPEDTNALLTIRKDLIERTQEGIKQKTDNGKQAALPLFYEPMRRYKLSPYEFMLMRARQLGDSHKDLAQALGVIRETVTVTLAKGRQKTGSKAPYFEDIKLHNVMLPKGLNINELKVLLIIDPQAQKINYKATGQLIGVTGKTVKMYLESAQSKIKNLKHGQQLATQFFKEIDK